MLDTLDSEKLLGATVRSSPHIHGLYFHGTLPGSHGKEPQKIPSWLWQENGRVSVGKCAQCILQNEGLLSRENTSPESYLKSGNSTSPSQAPGGVGLGIQNYFV